jgi:hypothetical protein
MSIYELLSSALTCHMYSTYINIASNTHHWRGVLFLRQNFIIMGSDSDHNNLETLGARAKTNYVHDTLLSHINFMCLS